MDSEFSRYFAEAVKRYTKSAGSSPAARPSEEGGEAEEADLDTQQEQTAEAQAEEPGEYFGYMKDGIIYDQDGIAAGELGLEEPDLDPVDLLGYSTGLYKLYKKGSEIVIGEGMKQVRIAPFGNRTSDKFGRWPHYHRRRLDKKGKPLPYQGDKRHRPWESKDGDTHWGDRY